MDFTDKISRTITSTLTSTTSTNTITTTKTSTSTVTTTTLSLSNCIDNAAKAKRGETPVAKPSCFSSYAGSVLSSACECLSIPTPTATVIRSTTVATTTTAKTVNVVAKTTTTVKAIKTATATVGSPNFYIQASGGNVDGEYAILPRSGENIIVEFTSLDPGTLFTLDDSCHLVVAAGNSTGKIANEDGVSSYGFVFISSEDLIEQFDYVYVTCSVDAGTDRLVCSVPSGSGDSVNDNGWQVGPDSPDTPITVTAIAG
ncbi:MAG: hypothetical protein M1820_002391 [Bogoriella megaspora]|nr:MAG: hypothetical protein M1820_002391 [Bogoriella megaspora]